MIEVFAKPAAAAIIEKIENNEKYILVQQRQKENGGTDNGLLELPAGKIREYENIYDALRREVLEETGLKVTKIHGEENMVKSIVNGHEVISFEPFYVTQNLSGVYSLIVNTFICEAEGNLMESTNETQNIRWMKAEDLKAYVTGNPDKMFIMHVNALKKYFNL